MDENKIVNVLKNSAPRHWFISVIGIISILSVLFFGVSFGWIFASLQDWPDFVIDIVVTVVLFITLANIIAWNLWSRAIIVMYGDRIVVKRKRLITLTKTYSFPNWIWLSIGHLKAQMRPQDGVGGSATKTAWSTLSAWGEMNTWG